MEQHETNKVDTIEEINTEIHCIKELLDNMYDEVEGMVCKRNIDEINMSLDIIHSKLNLL